MNDRLKASFPVLASMLVSGAASAAGAYMAVQVSIARLEIRMEAAEARLTALEHWEVEHEAVTRKGLADIARMEGRKK